jgi:hypothetical protein
MSKSNTSRDKGHRAERLYAKIFRDLGFIKCMTSRFGSRFHDNCKIDLLNLPFNVQIKAGKQKGLNPAKELWLMRKSVNENFREDSVEVSNFDFMLQRKEVVDKNAGRQDKDDIVHFTFSVFNDNVDFFNSINVEKHCKRRKNLPEFYDCIYSITFKDFIKYINIKYEKYKENSQQ